jgi:ankyrin repeat protein
MSPSIRKILSVALLSVCWLTLRAQTDSTALNSIARRINEILKEYNSYSIFVDTTEYVHDWIDSDDINLQIASSLGACNEIVRLFIRGADADNFVGHMARPIHYAVSSGKWEAVEILLLLGADPDSDDMYGNTPLITAVRANELEIAEKLIRYGASLTETDAERSAPLHHAAALDNFAMADMLLYYESPTELTDSEGNTPLMTGVGFGYYDIVDLLLQSGADPNAADKRGFTPLMAATQAGDTLMMSILVNAGANLYAVNMYGIDALGCAVISSREEAAAFLLDQGNRWDSHEGTSADPVTLANKYGRRDILQLMLDHGLKGKKEYSFTELSVSVNGMLTTHYQLGGVSISVSDPGFHTGIILGATLNPMNQRLLVKGNDDIIYQYKVRTNIIYAGLSREIPLSNPLSEIKVSFVPSLSLGYRFYSRYEGLEERPAGSLSFIPAADIRLSRNRMGLNAGLALMRMPFYKVGPAWFSVKVSYSLTRSTSNFTGKKIRLYNYEQN